MTLTWFQVLGPFGTGGELAGWALEVPRSFEFDVECEDTADAVVYRIPAPGMRKRDLEIELGDGVVFVRGRRTRGLFGSRTTSSLVRCFTLPPIVDASALRASFADGVLVVTAPKRPEARARRIPIRAVDAPAPEAERTPTSQLPRSGPAAWWRSLSENIKRALGKRATSSSKEVAS
jgi:HSP20 family protein